MYTCVCMLQMFRVCFVCWIAHCEFMLCYFVHMSCRLETKLILSYRIIFQRHFCVFTMNFPNTDALTTIYTSILSQHLAQDNFVTAVQKYVPTLIATALTLHSRVTSTFLPTAIKFHYIFNLRDLSNIFQVRILLYS